VNSTKRLFLSALEMDMPHFDQNSYNNYSKFTSSYELFLQASKSSMSCQATKGKLPEGERCKQKIKLKRCT